MPRCLQVLSLSSNVLPDRWRDITDEAEAKSTICQNPAMANGKLTEAIATTAAWMKSLSASHDRFVACGLAAEQVSMTEKLQRSHQDSKLLQATDVAQFNLAQCPGIEQLARPSHLGLSYAHS